MTSHVARAHDSACDITCLGAEADHTPFTRLPTGACDVSAQSRNQTCDFTHLPTGACDVSTKAAQSHDQTCEVTCLACDMQDDSDAMLPVINFKDGLQAGEEGRPGEEEEKNEGSGVAEDDSFSSSDTLSPSFLTSKFTGFIPHPPPHP